MLRKLQSNLWLKITTFVFFTLMISSFCFSTLLYFLITHQYIQTNEIKMHLVLAFFFIFSTLIGTLIVAVVSHQILKPIQQLGEQMDKVADGDFSIKLQTYHQIEEVDKLYRNFNTMVEKLNSIETLRNDFISNISHELKTPLATIQGYVQLIQNPDITENERQNYLSRINHNIFQLSSLTSNILLLTKLESQTSELIFESYQMDEQIRQVILFLEPKWSDKKISFDLQLESLNYKGNEELLYQVWLNLIDNAIKYSNDHQIIEISLQQQPNQITFCIKNNGPVIPKNEIKRIFDKFYQLKNNPNISGNGLGLSIVREIVELHQGTVWADCDDNNKIVFSIELPQT